MSVSIASNKYKPKQQNPFLNIYLQLKNAKLSWTSMSGAALWLAFCVFLVFTGSPLKVTPGAIFSNQEMPKPWMIILHKSGQFLETFMIIMDSRKREGTATRTITIAEDGTGNFCRVELLMALKEVSHFRIRGLRSGCRTHRGAHLTQTGVSWEAGMIRGGGAVSIAVWKGILFNFINVLSMFLFFCLVVFWVSFVPSSFSSFS